MLPQYRRIKWKRKWNMKGKRGYIWFIRLVYGVFGCNPIMENQLEKKVENEMDSREHTEKLSPTHVVPLK